jgi:uncharacterized membrane protein (DUF485 family)
MRDVDPRFVSRLMRRQASLAISVAAVFVLILLGLPLANALWPEAMASKVLGFNFTWLLLAVLFYPITWALSWVFVSRTEQIEREFSEEHHAE